MQSSLGVKTLLQDPALVTRSKAYSTDPKPPEKKPRSLSGIKYFENEKAFYVSITSLDMPWEWQCSIAPVVTAALILNIYCNFQYFDSFASWINSSVTKCHISFIDQCRRNLQFF